MNNQPLRVLFRLAAVGGAVAVGLTTHDAGFTAITLIGGLALPRILGISGHGHWHHGGCGDGDWKSARRAHFEERAREWHRAAHEQSAAG